MPIFATWEQPEGAGGSIRWVEDFRLAMLPFTKGVYVNTPDLSIKIGQMHTSVATLTD